MKDVEKSRSVSEDWVIPMTKESKSYSFLWVGGFVLGLGLSMYPSQEIRNGLDAKIMQTHTHSYFV